MMLPELLDRVMCMSVRRKCATASPNSRNVNALKLDVHHDAGLSMHEPESA